MKREGPVVETSPSIEDAAHEIDQENLINDIVSWVLRVTPQNEVYKVLEDLFPLVLEKQIKPAYFAGTRQKVVEQVEKFARKNEKEKVFMYLKIYDKLLDPVRSSIRGEYLRESLMDERKNPYPPRKKSR